MAPRDGSGTYSKPPGTTAIPNTTIASAPYNALQDDMADALTESLPRTGVAPMLADLSMNGNKITGLADGADAGDAVNFGQLEGKLNTDGGNWDGDATAQAAFRAAIGANLLSGFRNKIINGDFHIWQRGDSLSAGTGPARFSADRWAAWSEGTTVAISRQDFSLGQAHIPGQPSSFARVLVASVSGATNYALVRQPIEDVLTLAGKRATLTFYAKADTAKNIAVEFEQYFGAGGAPSSTVTGIGVEKVSLSTEWQRFDVIVDIPSLVGKTKGTDGTSSLRMNIWFDAGSDFSGRTDGLVQQSGTFDIAHVSLVEDDASAEQDPLSPRHVGVERVLCQRYYRDLVGLRGTNVSDPTNQKEWHWNAMRGDTTITVSNGDGMTVEPLSSSGARAASNAASFGVAVIRVDAELL